MKVILNATVPKVGKAGTVVTVKDGFARNYLFPRGLAIVAERKQVDALEKRNARLAAKAAETKSGAESLRESLQGKTVRIEAKVGKDGGKLFGAVTSQEVTDAIKAQLGTALDRKQVALIEPIRRLGTFPVTLDLHRDVDAMVQVEVFDPSAPVAPLAEAAPAEAPEEA
jgi:large subunit ribosomal protein L9